MNSEDEFGEYTPLLLSSKADATTESAHETTFAQPRSMLEREGLRSQDSVG